jgi:hypothetical protein
MSPLLLSTLIAGLALALDDPNAVEDTAGEDTAAAPAVELTLTPRPLVLFEARLPVAPASPDIGLAPALLGVAPQADLAPTPYINLALESLWRPGWGRALWPAQASDPYPGLDESPLNLVGQGLGRWPYKGSLNLSERQDELND